MSTLNGDNDLSRLQTSKFSMTSFYVTSFICQVHVCIYATNFIWQVFTWQVLFTGVKVSEKGVYRRHDRKIIIVRWPITLNAQITLTSFLCWPHWAILYYWRTCSASNSEAKNMADLTPFPWQHLLYFHCNCHWPTAILSFRRCP
jgi:hypothetical protein